MSREAQPIENFAPEMMETFKKASIDRVEVEFPDRQTCTKFRQRMYQLRRSMKEYNHELYPLAARVQITIKDDVHVVVCEPADSQFVTSLDKSGITIDDGE